MLVALLAILFLGGGTSAFLEHIAESEESIKTVLVNDDRQKQALNTLAAMKERTEIHNKQIKKTIKELDDLLEGRTVNNTEIAAIGGHHFESLESYSSDILDLRFELIEQLTREEWAEVFPEGS